MPVIDFVAHSIDYARDVFVPQHSEQRMRSRVKAHHVKVLRKNGRRVWIVGDIKHDGGLPGQHLKPRWKMHGQQSLPHRLLRNRQLRSQCFKRG